MVLIHLIHTTSELMPPTPALMDSFWKGINTGAVVEMDPV